jgi:hypothetical protein
METAETLPRYGAAYPEIFERDGQWLMGPETLGTIISYARGKAPKMTRAPGAPSALIMVVPLPTMLDEISGKQVDIIEFVPEELRQTVLRRLSIAVQKWLDEDTLARLNAYIDQQLTGYVVAAIDEELLAAERHRQARGHGELWECISIAFGFGLMPPAPSRLSGG